jgi:hypothetical protein
MATYVLRIVLKTIIEKGAINVSLTEMCNFSLKLNKNHILTFLIKIEIVAKKAGTQGVNIINKTVIKKVLNLDKSR